MGQKQAVNCDIATRRHLCVGRLTLGKHHTRTHMCVHAHMRTCAHGYMPRAYVHAANHGTATRDGIAATRRDLRGKAHVGKHHMRTHAFMRTCVRAYMRTYVRKHACTHVRMCTCIAHMSARMIFFSQREHFHT